jgi:hypothetical protein
MDYGAYPIILTTKKGGERKMSIEFDEYKQRLQGIMKTLTEVGDSL